FRVAAASGREPDREGRPRPAGHGNTLASGCGGSGRADMVRCIKIKTAEHQFAMRSRYVLKRHSMRLAAAFLVVLAGSVAGSSAAQPAAPQHHDQAPGFYRMTVGDLEVTALFDGTGVFDPHWLNGPTATMDDVLKALHEDPHLLDVAD